ncbi:MAG: hypothetical protein JW893_02265 [Candidatus Omnitrophica bacterium]|nr:hypothetical protein [Candidatus Omnitrophota bacterium]
MLIHWRHGLSLRIREMNYGKWKAVYLTVLPDKPIRSETTIRFLFKKLYQYLRKEKIQILLEKIYGLPSVRAKVDRIRDYHVRGLSKGEAVPFTYIGSTPCVGGKLAGLQMIGIVQPDKSVKVNTILFRSKPVGRVLETGGFRGVYLSGISGLKKNDKAHNQSASRQTEFIIEQCKDIFSRYDLTAQNVARTWIYFPRILHWYKRFNKIRAKYFQEFGLISRDKHYLPASTGIQGGGRPGEEIFVDLIGFVPKKKRIGFVSNMRSKRQDEARKYGATFSRGVEIKMEQASLMHISGTASINPKGETIYLGDEQGQITETLINIGALLESKKAHLRDVVLTAAYCKNKKVYEAFRDIAKYLGLEDIPFVPVYADVCRDDLLFEIDGIAVKRHG